MSGRYDKLRNPQAYPDTTTDADRIVYFPAGLSLGNFYLTTTESGSLVSASISTIQENPTNISSIVSSAPPATTPSKLVLDASGLVIEQSQTWGEKVLLRSLLDNLMDVPIFSNAGVEMSLRSLFGSLIGRIAAGEAVVADLSGVRIPAIVTEQLSNASLDAARELAQQLKDSAQDASGALIALSAATAASDIAGLSGRVTALEAAPGFDATEINNALGLLQTAVGLKADQTVVDGKADGSTVGALTDRVASAEGAVAGHGSRLDAVEAAAAAAVPQTTYDMYVASNDAAVAAVSASLGAKADASALADYALVADVDAKGILTKVETVSASIASVSEMYWGGVLQNVAVPAWNAGKLVEFAADADASFFSGLGAKTAGACVRVRNVGAGKFLMNMGSAEAPLASVEVQAGETLTLVSDGSNWRIV